MPLSAARDGDKHHPGATILMRFHSKYYEAEILKISGSNNHIYIPYCMTDACSYTYGTITDIANQMATSSQCLYIIL